MMSKRKWQLIVSGKSIKPRSILKDFYGNPDNITISVRLDVTQYDKIYSSGPI